MEIEMDYWPEMITWPIISNLAFARSALICWRNSCYFQSECKHPPRNGSMAPVGGLYQIFQMLYYISVKFCLHLLPFSNWCSSVFQFVGESWFCFEIPFFCFVVNFCRFSLDLLKSCHYHQHYTLNEILLA